MNIYIAMILGPADLLAPLQLGFHNDGMCGGGEIWSPGIITVLHGLRGIFRAFLVQKLSLRMIRYVPRLPRTFGSTWDCTCHACFAARHLHKTAHRPCKTVRIVFL